MTSTTTAPAVTLEKRYTDTSGWLFRDHRGVRFWLPDAGEGKQEVRTTGGEGSSWRRIGDARSEKLRKLIASATTKAQRDKCKTAGKFRHA